MCLDLDRFKEANDTYGHLVGDALLREAARRLQTAAEGAFLARIGGDEFIVVLSGDEPEGAAAIVGERMRLVARALPLALLLARGGKLDRPLPAFVAGLPVPGLASGALALHHDRRRPCPGDRAAN